MLHLIKVNRRAKLGVVVRNHAGDVLVSAALSKLLADSSLVAEMMAIKLGFKDSLR